ncbi:hypothetical protein B0H14DRAFT_2794995 [Mycena olivaceomarginata]|nr:hypothetical protein B0H14DRAFT_2794995 [Mycena olivaceomarginata]
MLLSLLSLAAFASTSIAIKHIHSHSDFIIMSVEADIWRQSIQLFTRTKTLNSLYLANILGIINGTKIFPHVVRAREPFGISPMHDSLSSAARRTRGDTFFDWDIRHLYSTKPGVRLEWGPGISTLASVDCSSVSSTAQMQELVLIAHDFGVRTRFWEDHAPSVWTWNTFWAAGSDWVNADDLLAVRQCAFNLKALEVEG